MIKNLNALWLPIGFIAAWQGGVAAGVLDPLFFPPPTQLIPAGLLLIESGELPNHPRITMSRMTLGFAIGGGSGLLIGVLMGWMPALRRGVEPAISALYTTPKMSLLPMLMLLFGVGDTSRIVLIAAGSFIMMSMQTVDAVGGINRTYLDVAKNYGASGVTLFRKVYLPATMPQIFTGLRLSLGRALMITVAVELVSCPDGLGSMVWMAWQTFATEKLYIGVIVIASLGALFHATLRRVEVVMVPWKRA